MAIVDNLNTKTTYPSQTERCSMKEYSLSSGLVLNCLMALVSCQGNDGPTMMFTLDQEHDSAMDMSSPLGPDAATSNTPGLVRYSYVCDNKPEKAVALPKEQFGAHYWCDFQSDSFFINVTDNRVPIDFRLSIPYLDYHGPGTYMMIADQVSGSGFSDCVWPSIRIQDANCPALAGATISSCCRDSSARASALSCSVTITQHSMTKITGTFTCHIQAEKSGINSPFMCPSGGQADVKGSFDFGPQDCK